MPWQELKDHINGRAVRVESRRGKTYVAYTDTDELNSVIYEQVMNPKRDDVDFWVWVEFPDDGEPAVKDFVPGDRPTSPPWEHP